LFGPGGDQPFRQHQPRQAQRKRSKVVKAELDEK
jgi:hypothetical protein